jgi:hypothetical protein
VAQLSWHHHAQFLHRMRQFWSEAFLGGGTSPPPQQQEDNESAAVVEAVRMGLVDVLAASTAGDGGAATVVAELARVKAERDELRHELTRLRAVSAAAGSKIGGGEGE